MNQRKSSPLSRLGLGLTLVILMPWISACSDTSRDDILEHGESLYSQKNEELIIRHFFDDRRDGFFLDVGAWEWRRASTTFYLEEHLGWSGIAIDAVKRHGLGYRQYRPLTKFHVYLVSDKSGEMGTIYEAGPLSSVDEDHLDEMKEAFPKLRPGTRAPPVQVPTITLDDLLDQNGVEEIDFLSMDIEGSEYPALLGFDIERFRPELVCIEVGAKTQDEVAAYFAKHGYRRLVEYDRYRFANQWYAPIDSEGGAL